MAIPQVDRSFRAGVERIAEATCVEPVKPVCWGDLTADVITDLYPPLKADSKRLLQSLHVGAQ